MLERMQADLVGLVGEVSDLDEEILELRRKVFCGFRSRRIWMLAMGPTPRAVYA